MKAAINRRTPKGEVMSDELRERLIVRILRMPPNLLADAERLLTNLECGNLSSFF